MKLPGWFWKFWSWLGKAHEAGLLRENPGVTFVTREERERQALEFIRKNRKRGLLLVLAAGSLSLAASCPNIPDVGRDCRFNPCSNGQVCTKPSDGSLVWLCRTPPDPTPTPCPSAPPGCTQLGPCKWVCNSPSPTPTATPSPLPTATPTPLPSPTPSPCLPKQEQFCADNEGNYVRPYVKGADGNWSCWNTKDWVAYMKRHNWLASNGTLRVVNGVEVGVNLGGQHGNQRDECTRTDDGFLVDCADPSRRIRWAVDPPRVATRTVPCPTPTPGPTPSPSVPPSPLPGVACTPLSHVGVAFHAQHPAPNGPLGYRWIFSATPKSRKPFCPDKRNECEQQAYQGDPVNDYDRVVWRFDLRFQCQDPAGPLWNQQEPHTGDSWENTDVRQENAYMANLKPAVKGLHRVRTCRRDAPTVCEITEKVAN